MMIVAQETKKQRGVIRKDRSDVALYCGRKGFPPDIFPGRGMRKERVPRRGKGIYHRSAPS